jgi:uncharacterized protein YbgA (DUF1722 family)
MLRILLSLRLLGFHSFTSLRERGPRKQLLGFNMLGLLMYSFSHARVIHAFLSQRGRWQTLEAVTATSQATRAHV